MGWVGEDDGTGDFHRRPFLSRQRIKGAQLFGRSNLTHQSGPGPTEDKGKSDRTKEAHKEQSARRRNKLLPQPCICNIPQTRSNLRAPLENRGSNSNCLVFPVVTRTTPFMNFRFASFSLFLLLLPFSLSGETDPEEDETITIRTVEGLRFSPVRFQATRGNVVRFRVENHDPNDQPHNLVIIKPGSLAKIQKASLEIGPDAAAKGFVPDHEAVLAATGLLGPDGEEEFVFTIPDKKGIYPFICTSPGTPQ